MVKKKIVWEKWIDPLNSNVDEVEYPGHSAPSLEQDRPIEFLSSDANFEEKYEEHLDAEENERGYGRNMTFNPMRIISTPQGFVSLTEHSFASKHFDFWTMHYNHDITREIADTIEKCEGVETINVLTRYRARIGFNRRLIQSGAFNLNVLRKNIENNVLSLGGPDLDLEGYNELIAFQKDVRDKVKNIRLTLLDSKVWAIYILPNGKIETLSEKVSGEIFREKTNLFRQTEKMIGGKLLTSIIS